MRMILPLLIVTALYAQDFTLSSYGPPSVYAGAHLYHQITAAYSVGPGGLYLDSCASTAGITCTILCLNDGNEAQDACATESSGLHRKYHPVTSIPERLALDVSIPASVAPGDYTATATFSNNGFTHPITVSFTVKPAPTAPTRATIRPIPLSGLKPWESSMLTMGDYYCKHQRACSPGGADCSFGVETEVWYYDAARNYYRMADYFQDQATWASCAVYQADQYKARVYSGSIQAWRKFPKGLYEAYRHTKDGSYKDALVDRLYSASAYNIASPQWDLIDEWLIREAAYSLETYVYARLLGQPASARGERLVDFLIGHLAAVLKPDYRIHQTFWDGLAMEALIEYYSKVSPDPRIPVTIKDTLDWVWTSAWSVPGHANLLMMNPAPHNETDSSKPYCAWGCADPTADGDSYTNQLNLLVAPAYAWYWWLTGDDTYRQRGDELWKYAMRFTPFTVSGGRITMKRHGLSDGTYFKVYEPMDTGVWEELTSSGLWRTQELYVRNPLSDSFQWAGTPTGTPSTSSGTGRGTAALMFWGSVFSKGKEWSQNARWGFDYVYWRTNEYRWLSDSRRQVGRSGVAGRVGR